jgi:hypothetical protein
MQASSINVTPDTKAESDLQRNTSIFAIALSIEMTKNSREYN